MLLGSLLSYVRLVGQEPASSKCVLLSTSREVRKDMKDWVLSLEGDKLSVKFDVRDLGGHLDTTFRGWSSTLAAGVRLDPFSPCFDFCTSSALSRSGSGLSGLCICPLPLHGIEASLLASDSLRKLRSPIHTVVWSRRQPLARFWSCA